MQQVSCYFVKSMQDNGELVVRTVPALAYGDGAIPILAIMQCESSMRTLCELSKVFIPLNVGEIEVGLLGRN
jgi:hypothetical protein